MALVTLLKNPFRLTEKEIYTANGTVIDWLQRHAPNGFGGTVYVFVEGKRLELDEWDYPMQENDHIVIAVSPAGPEVVAFIVDVIITLAVSYVVSKVFAPGTPSVPGYADAPEENTVYSLAAKQNAAKVGGVVPVNYGHVVTTPDYASQPYLEYDTIVVENLNTQLLGFVYFNDETGESRQIPYQRIEILEEYTGTGGQTQERILATIIRGQSYTLPDPSDDHEAFGYRDTGSGSGGTIYIDAGGYFQSDYNYTYHAASGENREGKQYLYYLLSIGQEFHTIEDILIGDMPVSLLPAEDIQYKDYTYDEHGSAMGNIALDFNQTFGLDKLFHENVITSLEVGTQELQGSEETLWYPVSPKHPINKIGIDISFDRGLFGQNATTGEFYGMSVRFIVRYRGPSDGNRDIIISSGAANVSPVRRTLLINVPEGAGYEVSIKRITAESASSGRRQDAFRWAGMRGYGSVMHAPVYGKTHLLAMRLISSESVAEAAQSRIRVACTRRLFKNLGTLMNSYNPIEAVNDIMTNADYGAGVPSTDLDTAYMAELRTYWGGRLADQGTYYAGFNGVFNGQTTVYDALKAVLAPMHAEPLPVGGLISVNAEGYRSFNTMVFSEANIVKGSFKMSYTMPKQYDYEGYRVRYRNPDTWQVEYVSVPEPSGNDSRYQEFELFGCVNSSHAKAYASFLWSKKITLRLSVQFRTELEGLIPQTGDRIGISHSMPSWSVSGQIISYDPDTLQIVVDKDLTGYGFSSNEGLLILRSEYGDSADYQICTLIDERTVQLASAPSVNVYDSLTDTPTLFVWGEQTTDRPLRPFTITNIEHNGGVEVTIDAIQFSADTYDAGGMPYLQEEKP